jgi:hypothetical protein
MTKFVVRHLRNETCVHEVNCEEVFTYSWELKPGEKRYAIISDKFMEPDGSYSIWMSSSFYDSEVLAINAAAEDLRHSMELWAAKGKEKFDEKVLIERITNIVVNKLEKNNGKA